MRRSGGNLPLLALRTASLSAAPTSAFRVEVVVSFNAGLQRATLKVANYYTAYPERAEHVEHLAKTVLEWGAWTGVTRLPAPDYGWEWSTDNIHFWYGASQAQRSTVDGAKQGPSNSYYQLIKLTHRAVGEDRRSQTVQYLFQVTPP